MTYIAPRHIYVVHDGSRLVNEAAGEAGFLLCPAGEALDVDVARRLGLLDVPLTPDPEPLAAPAAPAADRQPSRPRGRPRRPR